MSAPVLGRQSASLVRSLLQNPTFVTFLQPIPALQVPHSNLFPRTTSAPRRCFHTSPVALFWHEKVDQKLQNLTTKHDELSKSLTELSSSANADSSKLAALGRELADLEHLVMPYRDFLAARQELIDLGEMLKDAGQDKEMARLVEEDRAACSEKIAELQERIVETLVPADSSDSANVILEVRAGTGGEEAALFANEMMRTYERYAQNKGWRFEVLSLSPSERGIREGIANVSGEDVFGVLKFESGVHRVQRVPDTEKQGRIHTSTITVAVLPEPNEALTGAMKDFKINDNDLRIETMRASGAGGQSVNTTDSAVRITHLPTGTVVHIATERSQHQNKAKAMMLLQARLWDMRRREEAEKRSKLRASLVGSGARTEKIRTYNFPQGRVTDHRINYTMPNISQFVDGSGVDLILDRLIAEERTNMILNSLDD